MFNRVVVWGCGELAREFFDMFPKELDKVSFFIDNYSKQDIFYGKKIQKSDILSKRQGGGTELPIIVMARTRQEEICRILKEDYKVPEENIYSDLSWWSEALKDDENVLRPTRVRMDASTLCQLDCTDCYMRKANYGSVGAGALTFENFKRFVDENAFVHSIELSNSGEVFMNAELEQILEYAYQKGIEITISGGTNFNTVSEAALEALVKYNVKQVTVSIDGASQETYSIYRRKGNFEKVIEHIRKVNEWKKIYATEIPLMRWQYILMSHNEKDIELAVKMAEDLNMQIYFKLDWGGRYIPENPKKVKEITGLEVFNRVDYRQKSRKVYLNTICQQMFLAPQINWDGRLLGCCTVYMSDWEVNVFETGFVKSINSPSYRNAIRAILSNDSLMSKTAPCYNCGYFKAILDSRRKRL